MPAAVIFDLDGVILDSEQLWNECKQAVVRDTGGMWRDDAPGAMMGMSSPEWSAYMHDALKVDLPPEVINRLVVRRLEARYREALPVLPGAQQAVLAFARAWPLALASSSNREVIDLVVETAGLQAAFVATVSSEEVPRGKPAPDVYLEAARRLGVPAQECVAIEDSANGLRAATAAGMAVIAVPNPHYPPDAEALAHAAVTVATPQELTPELVAGLRGASAS